ncbi:MAG: hypothetical protein ABSB23_18350 [Bryobacteraceae bacterium]|jgi:hypothetical protein
MSNDGKRPLLLVVKPERQTSPRPQDFVEPVQEALFPSPNKALAVFVAVPEITENEFTVALESSRPTFVLELRACPRFDVGRLNRREAFQRFQNVNAQYVDVSSCAPSSGEIDVILTLRNVLAQLRVPGPLMFLLDSSSGDLADEITRTLVDVSAENWDICRVPSYQPLRPVAATR